MSEKTSSHDFLDYYFREMNYLREAGSVFAQEFPKIAGRLRLDGSETADPHVERLLEGFAFLSARLQKNIDNVAAETTNALLDVLFPHLNRPLPAMSIAQFQVGQGNQLPPQEGTFLKPKTEVYAYAQDADICRFSTVYPLHLMPISLEKIAIVSKGAYQFVSVPNTIDFGYGKYQHITSFFLELTLSSPEFLLANLELDHLLFYLNMGSSLWKKQVYRALFTSPAVMYCSRGDERMALPMLPSSLQPMGFARDEMALPPAGYETHAYQLLQEFFHFPDKFMFFKVQNLKFLRYLRKGNFLQTHRIKLLVPLQNASSDWERQLEQEDILLNCTPIVNLHEVTTDPISWDRKQTFYHLSPNSAHERTQEIYRILDVFSIDTEKGTEKRICPYFSLEKEGTHEDLFWWSRLEPTQQKNIQGVDSWITFVDAQDQTIDPSSYVIYAKTLCTNRFLAEDIPQGVVLQADRALPIDGIVCLQKPVFPQYFLDKGTNNTKLIAQLSGNFLGFPYGDQKDIANQIRCILNLHTGPSNKEYGEVLADQLRSVFVEKTVRRKRKSPWPNFQEGFRVSIDIKRSNHTDDWFLLAQVLHRYFVMNCQINTFVDLELTEEGVPVASFDGLAGELAFL